LPLDAWPRSGLPAGAFAPLVGISKHNLYAWNRKFQEQGAGELVAVAVPPSGMFEDLDGGRRVFPATVSARLIGARPS
jgi:hypothetical protein